MTLLALILGLAPSAQAVPLQLGQQGRLLDSSGAAITGTQDVDFRIYDAQSGGSQLWTETLQVDFVNGYYAAILGANTESNPLDADVLSLHPIYLEVEVDGTGPLSPRQSILSTPYAQMAGVAENLEGGTVDATQLSINGTVIIDGDGNWQGSDLSVDWSNVANIPNDLADGDDNSQLSESDVEGFVTNGPLSLSSGTTLSGATILTEPAGGCSAGELLNFDGAGWICVSDNTLSEEDVRSIVSGAAIDLAEGSSMGTAGLVTVDSDMDTLYELETGCVSGDIPVYDGASWSCQLDSDSFADIPCTDGELIQRSGVGWTCVTDQVLETSDVLEMVEGADIGLGAGSTLDGEAILTESTVLAPDWTNITSIPEDIADGDDDTQLSQPDVVGMLDGADLALGSATTVGGSAVLTNPGCDDGDVLRWDEDSGAWVCAPFSSLIDADQDGSLSWLDCDDSDSNLGDQSADADCDGVETEDDCDDENASAAYTDSDADCDGVETADDCDDENAAAALTDDDADCDGTATADDCNDGDPSLNGVDADADGTSTCGGDCDDEDAASTTQSTDADCDTYESQDVGGIDCDDTDPSSNTTDIDGDCDSVLTADDCDDADASLQNNDGLSSSCPGHSCYELLNDGFSVGDGTYYIRPDSTTIEVTCDMTTDGGGYTYYPVSGGVYTNRYTDNNTCKGLGMDIVFPRTENHWSSMVSEFGTGYFPFIPGIYKSGSGGNYTNCVMRSGGCSDWRVGDGGQWFLRSSTYSEPNGDYTGNCWLDTRSVSSPSSITFNDGNCGAGGSSYICSTNDKP
jgi:hypothetical protein